MRAASRLVAPLAVAVLAIAAPAQAGSAHKSKGHSGVKGVVLDSTCYGPCAEPPPPAPAYSGLVTITASRASDGTLVASREISDGHFRIRLRRGQYDVSAVPPNPSPCQPQPGQVCPAGAGAQSAVIAPCMTGETKRVRVRRHRFTHVELHVANVCVV